MAYIGNDLEVAFQSYLIIDDISSGFDGSETSFTLNVNGAVPVPFPINPQQCLISVAGVIQEPDPSGSSGFNLSGNNIVFSSPPAGSSSFFGVVLAGADYVNVGVDFPAGSESAPSITFVDDKDSGFFSKAANEIGIACAGTEVGVFSATGLSSGFADGSAASPSIFFTSDTNTGIARAAADELIISAGGVERVSFGSSEVAFNDPSNDVDFRVESNGNANMLFVDAGNDRVGIGTSSPAALLTVGSTSDSNTNTTIASSTSGTGGLYFHDGANSGALIYDHTNNFLQFRANGSERMRIDSSGRLLIGRTSALNVGAGSAATTEIQNSSGFNLSLISTLNSSGAGGIAIGKARGSSVVQDDDDLGSIVFAGHDGTDFQTRGASITAQVDGTPGSNDMPGRLVFSTTADGASSTTERMRIDSSGNVGIGTTSVSNDIHLKRTGADAIIRIENTGNGNHSGIFFVREASSGTSKGAANIHVESNTGGTGTALIFGCGSNTSATGGERMRIDSSGRVLIGTTSARSVSSLTGSLQVEGTSGDSSTISVTRNVASAAPPRVCLAKSRGTSVGSSIAVQSGDSLGEISFSGADGTDANSVAATILCQVDGTPGSNDMPGRIHFSTTADGASTPTERMRIDSSGNVGIGRTPFSNVSGYALQVRGSSTQTFLHLSTATHGDTHDDGIIFGSDNNDGYIVQREDAPLIISTNNTERLRVLAAGGLTFNGDTAAANALDDYEEGTWTPVPNFGGGTTGITYTTSPTGNYTKIGNLVFVVMGFQFSNKGSSTGSFTVTGLPYSVASTASFKHPNSVVNAHNMTNNNKVYAALGSGSAINYRRISDSNTDAVPGDGDFTNNSGFYHSLVYVT